MMLMFANKFKIQKTDIIRIQLMDEEIQEDGSTIINSVSGAVMTIDAAKQLRDLLIQIIDMNSSTPEVKISH
jgi:hypothetical protein